MENNGWLFKVLVLISGLTIISGVVQMMGTRWELSLLSSEVTPASIHFFAIIGMFMVLFGCLLVHALMRPVDRAVAIFWAGVQKFGASVAVGLGVSHAIFSALALLVAGFDLISGVLIFAYWLSLRQQVPT